MLLYSLLDLIFLKNLYYHISENPITASFESFASIKNDLAAKIELYNFNLRHTERLKRINRKFGFTRIDDVAECQSLERNPNDEAGIQNH